MLCVELKEIGGIVGRKSRMKREKQEQKRVDIKLELSMPSEEERREIHREFLKVAKAMPSDQCLLAMVSVGVFLQGSELVGGYVPRTELKNINELSGELLEIYKDALKSQKDPASKLIVFINENANTGEQISPMQLYLGDSEIDELLSSISE